MSEPSKPGLADSLHGLLDTGLHTVQTRIELLTVELQEEKLRLTSLLFNTLLSAVLLGFSLVFVAVFLTVLFWEEHRLLALGLASALFICGGLLTATNAAREIRRGSRLFAATLAEIARDREAIRRRE
ncbi:MAG: phage holin family protein [Thauera sp.]|nr:phage holin family protein [Thauera sp.]